MAGKRWSCESLVTRATLSPGEERKVLGTPLMLAVNPNRRILSVVVTTCDSFGAVLTVFRDCCGNAPHGLVPRSRANALDPNTRAANGPPPNAENRRSGLINIAWWL